MAAKYTSLSATAQVNAGFGKVKGILCSSGTNPSIAIYDSSASSTSDPKILATTVMVAGTGLLFTGDDGGAGYSKGLYIVLAGTNPVFTVTYE